MEFHFTTSGIFVDDDGSVLMLVLNSDDQEHYFSIQLSHENDEHGEKTGTNTYYIEIDDQSFGGYGGLQNIRLSRKELRAVLNETGRKNLKMDSVTVSLHISDNAFRELQNMLTKIFSSTGLLKQD